MPRRLPPPQLPACLRSRRAPRQFHCGIAGAAASPPRRSSQQVLVLERYLGARLFKRLPRGLVLTATGRTYLPELTAGFDRLAEATTPPALRRCRRPCSPWRRCPPSPPAGCCPACIGFRERYPRIELLLKTDRALLDFRREDIDLAIRFSARHARRRPVGRAAAGGRSCFLSPVPRSSRRRALPLQVADLAGAFRCFTTRTPPAAAVVGLARAGSSGQVLDVAPTLRGMRFSDSIVLLGAAIAGLGVALGRSPHIEGLLARGQLVRLTSASWKAGWSYHLVGRRRTSRGRTQGLRRMGAGSEAAVCGRLRAP